MMVMGTFGSCYVVMDELLRDPARRSKAYEVIVKGDPMPTPGIPESLNVLLNELKGLGLSFSLD